MKCPSCGVAMATGTISLESTLFGWLIIGASYQVLTFTADGGRKLKALSSIQEARAFACPSRGLVALRSKESPSDKVKPSFWTRLFRKS